MLKQIRSLVQTSISIFFSDINYIDKKNYQIILEQVPSLSEEFYEKMVAILNKMNKMATISCVDRKTSCSTERAQHCGIVFKILYGYHF
jgi:hypothetical protein